MDTKRFKTIQDELDYWALIERAAKDGVGVPDHDCNNILGEGCQMEIDYQNSRDWWTDARNFMKHEN